MKTVYLGIVCSLAAALSFGFVIGYSSPSIPQMLSESFISEEVASWFGSFFPISALVGSVFSGWAVEKYGRKSLLLFCNFPYTFGWFFIYNSNSVYALLFGRFLTGFASGITTVVAPLYVTEICPENKRGLFGSCLQLSITIGIFLSYYLGSYLSWRDSALTMTIIPIVSAIITCYSKETPAFLFLKNRKKEALASLKWFKGDHIDEQAALDEMEGSVEGNSDVSWSEFKKKEYFQPLKLALLLNFFQQTSGINCVMFYAVSIFESAGFKDGTGPANTLAAVQIFATVAACYLMDKVARRKLLLIGGVGMSLSCLGMVIFYDVTNGVASHSLKILVVYIVAFSLSWGPMTMLVSSEILPRRIRGTAMAMAIFTNHFMAFITTKAYSSVLLAIGPDGVFALFGISMLLSTIYCRMFIPETKGKTLEEIESHFRGAASRAI